jgi:hypothetical protein
VTRLNAEGLLGWRPTALVDQEVVEEVAAERP